MCVDSRPVTSLVDGDLVLDDVTLVAGTRVEVDGPGISLAGLINLATVDEHAATGVGAGDGPL